MVVLETKKNHHIRNVMAPAQPVKLFIVRWYVFDMQNDMHWYVLFEI